jgi:glycosyltransferase involved in cell wall biosynthesis
VGAVTQQKAGVDETDRSYPVSENALKPPTVEVLLATWNGERYLSMQLQSLLAQTTQGFVIVVSDDCSSDETLTILETFASAHPGLMQILPPVGRRLGACANFARLLAQAKSEYIFFCDQDDIWLPDKVEVSLKRMRSVECQSASNTPILVHTDLVVVDEVLRQLQGSYFRFTGLDPRSNSLGALLLGNASAGCTQVANRALYELARPIPSTALMHDHWLALIAVGLERLEFVAVPTVLYRQHSGNFLGAFKGGSTAFYKRLQRALFGEESLQVFTRFVHQSQTLATEYGEVLGPFELRQASVVGKVWGLPRRQRFAKFAEVGVVKTSLVANIGLFVLLLRNG